MNPCELTLVEAADAVRQRRCTSRELVEAALARIAQWQPAINAYAALQADAALAAAERADAAVVRGAAVGPLHGVPLAHKDMFFRPGRRSSLGSRAAPPAGDARSSVLARLDAAGAIELGTLNMAEFALGPTGHNAYLGDCRNPWQDQHITCGSSSGCGAAVGARLAWGSIGSDTGGSVRLPASACGVLGLKPTNGRVSLAGMMPLAPSVDAPGILARSARDVARLLGVVAGHDPADARSSRRPVPDYEAALPGGIAGLRVGVPENFFREDIAADVGRAVDASLRELSRLGATVLPVTVPAPEHLTELSRVLVYAEAAAVHGPWLREHAADYSPQVRTRAATGLAIPAAAYQQAQQLRPRLLRGFVSSVFAQCDVLHLPTLGIPVPTLAETDVGSTAAMWDKIAVLVRCTAPFNYLGLPALAVPCGFTDNGLPTSFQLVARPFDEAALLRVAHAYETTADWASRVPVLRSSTAGDR